MEDGWQTYGIYEIYVEDGCVLRGKYKNATVYPYKRNPKGGWDNATGVKYETLIHGLREGRYEMN